MFTLDPKLDTVSEKGHDRKIEKSVTHIDTDGVTLKVLVLLCLYRKFYFFSRCSKGTLKGQSYTDRTFDNLYIQKD